MKFFATTVTAVSLVPSLMALTINTPTSLTVCQPSLLQWSDGTAPYYLSIIPGGDTSSAALKTFDSSNATSVTWTVDIAASTSVSLEIKDSTGTIAYSDKVSISSGTTTDCVSSSTAASGSTGSAASTSGSSSATSSGSSASATTTGSKSASASSASGSSTTASASGDSNAASRANINFGIAGLLGLVGAAML